MSCYGRIYCLLPNSWCHALKGSTAYYLPAYVMIYCHYPNSLCHAMEGSTACYLTADVMLWKDLLPVTYQLMSWFIASTLTAYVMILFQWNCSETNHHYKGIYCDDNNYPSSINNSTFRRSFGSKKNNKPYVYIYIYIYIYMCVCVCVCVCVYVCMYHVRSYVCPSIIYCLRPNCLSDFLTNR